MLHLIGFALCVHVFIRLAIMLHLWLDLAMPDLTCCMCVLIRRAMPDLTCCMCVLISRAMPDYRCVCIRRAMPDLTCCI